MGLLSKLFGSKEIQIEQLEVLFHTEAAYFGEHGRLIASNRAEGIIEKEVIFCLKGHTEPLPLNHRLFAHIWKEAQAQGFIPLSLAKYGSVIENANEVDALAAHRRVLAVLREHGQLEPRRLASVPMAEVALSEALPSDEVAEGTARSGFPAKGDFSRVDVPAYLRKEQQEGTGFKSAGFDAAMSAS
jgi:hypothetical protein